MTKQEFIKEIAKYVQKYAPEFGIKVCSPIIAQACLESAYGTSEKATHHNYFGLKYRANRVSCNKGYFMNGGSEQNTDGTYTLLPSSTAWYAFENMEKGVLGYFQFINISNYSNLKGITDPYEYLENIKKDGYATSLNYVKNVYNVIKDWNLTQYDIVIKEESKMVKLAIDAGHGSTTAGKRTPDGYKEHWINVKTAYYCEQLLKQHGIEVLRVAWDDTDATDDTDVSLSTRQKLIRDAKCDYSVSIHANAYGDGASYNSAEGVSTHIHSVEGYKGDSYALAKSIQNELIKGTAQKNRGIVLQNLAMCNCVNMGTKASCLVEIAFMTNLREANLMKTENFCKEQGEDIARGILKYLDISVKPSTTTPNKNQTTTSTNTSSSKFTIGEQVRLREGATYTNGQKPATFVYNTPLYVRAINGSSITISTLKVGAITGVVNSADLTKINNSSTSTSAFKSYIVQVTVDALNIRKGPGTNYAIVRVIQDRGKYTIVEEKNGFGKLKSGAGWISLSYTKKI